MGRSRNIRRSSSTPATVLRHVWEAVLGTPHATALAAGLAVVASAVVAWLMCQTWVASEAVQQHAELAYSRTAVREFTHFFIDEWMKLSFLLLTPALVLGLVRSRGIDKILPLGIASFALLIFWLQRDLYEHYASSVSTLGEEPSQVAYWCKLLVTTVAILSPVGVYACYVHGSILDRYVIRTFAVPFALCFLGLLALFVIFDFFNNGTDFIDAKFGLGRIALFYLVQVPKFTVEVLDISLLLGVLYALSRMSRYNEVISMVTAGRSIPRILMPLFIVGFFASALSMACNFQWAPEAERKKTDMLRQADEAGNPRQSGKQSTNPERVAYINRADRRFWYCHEIPIDLSPDNRIQQVEIHEHDKQGRLVRSLYAKSAYWLQEEPPQWVFRDVKIFEHGSRPERLRTLSFARYPQTGWAETPWRLLSESAKLPAQFLSVPQLTSYLKSNREFPEVKLASYRTWWHDRLARPLRAFIVILFAAPLGLVFSRRGLMGSVGSTMLLYFGMYVLAAIFLRLGETYKLPAAPAAWFVNVLFLVIGTVLLWQRSTNTAPRALVRRLAFWKKA